MPPSGRIVQLIYVHEAFISGYIDLKLVLATVIASQPYPMEVNQELLKTENKNWEVTCDENHIVQYSRKDRSGNDPNELTFHISFNKPQAA